MDARTAVRGPMIPFRPAPAHPSAPRRGRACPARTLSAAARYCFTHPVSPHTVGRGLDPSAARRGRRPLQRWPETTPHPRTFRPAPAHPSTTPVGAGQARPATNPSPAVNLPPPTHSPKKPNPATRLPPTPHNLYPPTALTPIYILPKLLPQTLSKKSKKLAKTC